MDRRPKTEVILARALRRGQPANVDVDVSASVTSCETLTLPSRQPAHERNRRPATGNRQWATGTAAWPGHRREADELGRRGDAGANDEEARAAESRADFVHKVGVAAKEMREACYWFGLVHRSGWLDADLTSIVREAGELAAILGASARTARARAPTTEVAAQRQG